MGSDDFFDLIHRFYHRRADLLTLVGSQRRQQAVRFGGAAAEADRQVIRPRIVQEPLAGNFHPTDFTAAREHAGLAACKNGHVAPRGAAKYCCAASPRGHR